MELTWEGGKHERAQSLGKEGTPRRLGDLKKSKTREPDQKIIALTLKGHGSK